jgi:hypothetical protein
MKTFFAFSIMIFSLTAIAQSQENQADANLQANTQQLQRLGATANGSGSNAVQGTAVFYNPKFDREGSVYLFDGWDNRATVYTKNNGGSFRTENINFNIQRSMFESKRNDSIRSYNFASIDRIVIGSRSFKSYYFEPLKRQKVFEVIYTGEDFTLLKDYTIDILEASPNPMIARPRDKVIQRTQYYMDTEESLTEFKLNKRNILKALGPVKAEMAKEYSKEYQKSFSKEEDLKMILNYVQHQ